MSVEIIESYPNLRAVNYVLSMSFEQFRPYSLRWDNEKERKALFKRIHGMCEEIIRAKGLITRVYHYSLNTPSGLGGRLFGPTSIQSVPREIRGLLFKHTTDIDMKNAHPVILKYLCNKYDIKCPQLEYYINHRDEIIGIGPEREQKKCLYLKALNKDKVVPEIRDFSNEIIKIQKSLFSIQEFSDIIETLEAKQWNKGGSFLNKCICIYENKILECVRDFIYRKGFIVRCLAFDGLMIEGNHYENTNLLTELESVVNAKFCGLNMVFTFKPHDNSIVIPDNFHDGNSLVDGLKLSFVNVAKEFEKTHCKITNTGTYVERKQNRIIVRSPIQLKNSFGHMIYEERDKSGEIIQKNFINSWVCSNPNIRCYEDVGVFPKLGTCPPHYYNMWLPFEMESVEEYTHHQEGLDAVLNHLRILCGHEEPVFEYLKAWIAQMIQYPEVKSNCPTMISKEGAGKGTLLTLFKKMLGHSKVFETTNPSRDVWGDFNGQMADCYLVNLNELSKKDTIESAGKIKGLITDSTLTINNKGVNKYEIPSYHRFFGSTNSEEPWNTAFDDRRNWIIRCSDELIGNKEYFDNFYELMNNTNVIKTCYEYFKSIPGMDKFHKIPVPVTEYQKNLAEYSKSPIQLWLEHFAYTQDDVVVFTSSELYAIFDAWLKESGFKHEINSLQFTQRLARMKIDGISTVHTRVCKSKEFDFKRIRAHLFK